MKKLPLLSDAWIELFMKGSSGASRAEPGVSVSIELAIEMDNGTIAVFTQYIVDGQLVKVGGADPDADVHGAMPEEVYVGFVEQDEQVTQRGMLTGQFRLVGDADKAAHLGGLAADGKWFDFLKYVHQRTQY